MVDALDWFRGLRGENGQPPLLGNRDMLIAQQILKEIEARLGLIIRTGNEKRLSNFLLWQAAYSELYFSKLLWPDFDEAALDAALLEYASRERRFGKTSNQVVSVSAAPLP